MSLNTPLHSTGWPKQLVYVGDRTCFCTFIQYDRIGGLLGAWMKHEFGGIVFNPVGSTACYDIDPTYMGDEA